MATTISFGARPNVRSSIVYAADLKVGIIANGENETSIIDLAGNIYPAGIPIPTNAPVYISQAVSTGLDIGFYGYRYVYASNGRYPFINAQPSINGFIGPRGNPSPFTIVNVAANNTTVTIQVNKASRQDIDTIYIFRTDKFVASADATTAAGAGLMWYVGAITTGVYGTGTINYNDNVKSINISLGIVEFDNFFAPTARYAVYSPPNFFLFANDPLKVQVNWDTDTISLVDLTDRGFFIGRNGQFATLVGVTTGGIDGKGTFIWKTLTISTGAFTLDGVTPVAITPTTGTGFLVVQGASTTLYKSKPQNPFAWGETLIFGTIQQSQLFSLKVGGGLGTAIGVLPGGEILKLDTKQPNKCYTLNLRLAGFPEFVESKRIISELSISNHFSQFVATTPEKNKVLWGIDTDSLAILQSDGVNQSIISEPVQRVLSQMDTDPVRQEFCHGACLDRMQINCLWIPLRGKDNDAFLNWTDECVVFQYDANKWTRHLEFDTTCSAVVTDLNHNRIAIVGGTATGIIGEFLYDFPTAAGSFTDGIGNYIFEHYDVANVPTGTMSVVGAGSSFSFGVDYTGLWVQFSRNIPLLSTTDCNLLYFGRIANYDTSTLQFVLDYLIDATGFDISNSLQLAADVVFAGTANDYDLVVGNFPSIWFKYLKGDEVSKLEDVEGLWLIGDKLQYTRCIFHDAYQWGEVCKIANEALLINNQTRVWPVTNMYVSPDPLILLEFQLLFIENPTILNTRNYPPYIRGIAVKYKM